MKKFFLYLEFLLVCVIFIIPPFFAKPVTQIQNSNFSLTFPKLIFLAINLLIYYRYEFTKNQIKTVKKFNILIQAGNGILCYGILIFTGTVISVITMLLKVKPPYSTRFTQMTALSWVLIILSFLIFAFCEESIFRLYLPCTLKIFAEKFTARFFNSADEKTRQTLDRISFFLVEFISVAVFALSHIYLGVWAVINAFLSGITLRYFAVKNRTILTGSVSHFFYNLSVFILLYFLKD